MCTLWWTKTRIWKPAQADLTLKNQKYHHHWVSSLSHDNPQSILSASTTRHKWHYESMCDSNHCMHFSSYDLVQYAVTQMVKHKIYLRIYFWRYMIIKTLWNQHTMIIELLVADSIVVAAGWPPPAADCKYNRNKNFVRICEQKTIWMVLDRKPLLQNTLQICCSVFPLLQSLITLRNLMNHQTVNQLLQRHHIRRGGATTAAAATHSHICTGMCCCSKLSCGGELGR